MDRWLRVVASGTVIVMVGCATPQATKLAPPTPARLGESFTLSPQNPWHHTGIQVAKGTAYRITAEVPAGERYADDIFHCSPDGPDRLGGAIFDRLFRKAECPLRPMHHLGPGTQKRLRVLEDAEGRRASFLTLMATVGETDDPARVRTIGRDGVYVAPASGELVLFANDWPGTIDNGSGERRYFNAKGCLISTTYLNNRGRLSVIVRQCPPPHHPTR